MRRIAYKLLDLTQVHPKQGMESTLNELGEMGWDLVQITTLGIAVLKRELPARSATQKVSASERQR